tara:strand:+ start:14779 stop:17436 length:2658 start_codon:yes stop_codon:yes gene_type:complete
MKQRSVRIISSLSPSAQKFVSSSGWEMGIENKEKVFCICNTCGFEAHKSWDMLSNKSVTEHCISCKNALLMVDKFNLSYLGLANITCYKWHGLLDKVPKGVTPHDIRYTLNICDKHASISLLHSQVKSLVSKYCKNISSLLKCQLCENEIEHKQLQCIVKKGPPHKLVTDAIKVWGNLVSISVVGLDEYHVKVKDSSSFYPDGAVPIKDLLNHPKGRLKGALDHTLNINALSKMINADLNLVNQIEELNDTAPKFGAQMYYVCYVPANDGMQAGFAVPEDNNKTKSGVYFRYKKSTKYFSNWQSYHRVKDTNFGRTGIKSEQSWVGAALAELFPKNEQGQITIWIEDNRTLLKTGYEIDISSPNLFAKLGGLQVEYDGHQSHVECKLTKERDDTKHTDAPGVFLRINKISHLNAKKAVDAILDALSKSKNIHSREFLSIVNLTPNLANVRQDYIERNLDISMSFTNSVLKKAAGLDIFIKTQSKYFLPQDPFDYLCANCKSLVKLTAKRFIDDGTDHCSKCKGSQITKTNIKGRVERYEKDLGVLWSQLPHSVQLGLTTKGLKNSIRCPQCEENIPFFDTFDKRVNFIRDNNGFICVLCHNTGVPIVSDLAVAQIIWDKQEKIKQIVSKSHSGHQSWFEYVTVEQNNLGRSEILINITCPEGHQSKNSLRQWGEKLASSRRNEHGVFCDTCFDRLISDASDNLHLSRIKQFHPSAYAIDKSETDTFISIHCGQSSRISTFKVQHPQIWVNKKKLKDVYDAKSYGEHSYCIVCAELYDWQIPGGRNNGITLELRVKTRLAIYASVMRKECDLDSVKVLEVSGEKLIGEVPSGKKVRFECEYNNVLYIREESQSNFFNKSKFGFFPELMKLAKAKRFRDILAKYEDT